MGGFRIGRKYASHVYPTAFPPASGFSSQVLKFSNNQIAVGGNEPVFLSDNASDPSNATVTPSTVSLRYPSMFEVTLARLQARGGRKIPSGQPGSGWRGWTLALQLSWHRTEN